MGQDIVAIVASLSLLEHREQYSSVSSKQCQWWSAEVSSRSHFRMNESKCDDNEQGNVLFLRRSALLQ